jgi:hypothetical protein
LVQQSKSQSLKLGAATLLVVAAAICAASVKALQSSCGGCEAVSHYQPLPHTSAIGTIYYIVLALALWRFKLNRYTLLGLYFAAGFHLCLLVLMAHLHLLCVPCTLCALCVGGAAILTMSTREWQTALAVLTGATAMNVSSFLYDGWQQRHFVAETKQAIGYDQLDFKVKDALPIYVFERDGCHLCQVFEDLYVPKLKSTYGKAIVLHVRSAPENISTPTIVVGGANPALWEATPSWRELSAAIDANLRLSHLSRNHTVAATGRAFSQ